MTKQNFADLFKQSLENTADVVYREGDIIKALVVKIDKNVVILDANLKSESPLNIEEFKDINGNLEVAVGDYVDVILEQVENGNGETRLSREKAKREEIWQKLQHLHDEKITVIGKVTARVKGGFTVDLEDIKAFLPGSLVDVRPTPKDLNLEGKELEFKVIKLDQKRSNVVVSRRAILELENSADRESLLENLEEGSIVTGIVKNLTDYGAFIDLGGVDGLLHITDMAWKRIGHPSEVVNVGDEIQVKVLKYDREKTRVSLGLKQLGQDPWNSILNSYQIGSRFTGKVSNITEYGCFVEILEGVEGLVHVTEMDWTNRNIHPSKVVEVGEEVQVQVLEIDEDRRRISLGIKQCRENPWIAFNEKASTGDRISGKIKSITDFGIFIGLEGGIDGLVHVRDITWDENAEEALTKYKKGDTVEAVVLQVDAEKERISLGIKHLEEDSFSQFTANLKKGDELSAIVIEVEPKGAKVLIDGQYQGFIKASDLSDDKSQTDATTLVKQGDEISAFLINVDRKTRTLNLSVRAKEEAETSKNIEKANVKVASTAFADAFSEAGLK